jgi:tripartite-type tricarboxylate transporter receptor subunit TctC
VPGYEAVGWFGLLAPARTPPEIIKKLNAEITAMMDTPDVRDRLASLGAEPEALTPQDFGRYINEDIAKWTRLVRENRIVMPGAGGSGTP